MQGLLLDRTVSVWRKVLDSNSGQYVDTQVMPSVRCAIVPISRLDQVGTFAYESSHLVWVEYWLTLRKEDQLRAGRRGDPEGDTMLEYIYTVNGRREFRLGIPQTAYYAREQE